jgi:hypothetical protein
MRSERGTTALLALFMVIGIGYLVLLTYLAFANWKAAIFLLLLAIATNTGRTWKR